MTTEMMIEADTKDLREIAEDFSNVEVVYKAFGFDLPYRWEVQTSSPRHYLGVIQLTGPDIVQTDTARRIILRREFLRTVGGLLSSFSANPDGVESVRPAEARYEDFLDGF